MTYPRGGSEYGGMPGLIQPLPHDFEDSAAEQMMTTYMTDPADTTSTPESVRDRLVAEGRQRANDEQ